MPHRIHSGVHLLYGQPFALSVKLCFLSRGKDDHPFFIIAFDFNLSFYQSGLCRFAGFAALEVEGGSKYPYLHGFALHDKGFCFIFGYFEIGFTFQINVSLFVGEFGGVVWAEGQDRNNSWGYGDMLTNEEGFYERLESYINAILFANNITGFCYTQFTDIEQEKNGIYYYDRRPKLNMERIKAIFEKIPSRPQKEKKE